jgi:lysophospholipid acyltransferase (LPLAT)-like uncharacterized protein
MSTTPSPAKKSSAIVIPVQPRGWERFLAFIIYVIARCFTMTLRCRWTDRSGLDQGQNTGPNIYCIWHNRLALCMMIYSNHIARFSKGKGLAVMASASRDGGLLIAVLEKFGVQPARGSSSRRGAQALRELTTWARKGYDLAITPDGPRGPRYVLQDGIVSLAQLTGFAIVPVTCNFSWKIRLKSWDGFMIPLPFSRCEIILEPPVHVPRESTPEEREEIRKRVENILKSVSEA